MYAAVITPCPVTRIQDRPASRLASSESVEFATPVPIWVRIAVQGHRGRIVGGQVTRFQNGRGGRGGDGGSPTQEICWGPASTDGENAFEGSAWNLDDDEEPDREGPFIDTYNI